MRFWEWIGKCISTASRSGNEVQKMVPWFKQSSEPCAPQPAERMGLEKVPISAKSQTDDQIANEVGIADILQFSADDVIVLAELKQRLGVVDLTNGRSGDRPLGALRIAQFIKSMGMSRSTYYELKKHGRGPRTYKIGNAVFISIRAVAEWQARWENSA